MHATVVVKEGEQCTQTHDNTHETSNVSREALFDHKETEIPEIANLWNQAETQNVTDLSLVSMELTPPLDTSIKTTLHESSESRLLPQKKTQKKKPTITNKKREHGEASNLVANEIFDCNNDDFLVNPDKRIKLAKEDKPKEKQNTKSLPLIKITNEPTERRVEEQQEMFRTPKPI